MRIWVYSNREFEYLNHLHVSRESIFLPYTHICTGTNGLCQECPQPFLPSHNPILESGPKMPPREKRSLWLPLLNLGKVVKREVGVSIHAGAGCEEVMQCPLAFMGGLLLEPSQQAVRKYKELHGCHLYPFHPRAQRGPRGLLAFIHRQRSEQHWAHSSPGHRVTHPPCVNSQWSPQPLCVKTSHTQWTLSEFLTHRIH